MGRILNCLRYLWDGGSYRKAKWAAIISAIATICINAFFASVFNLSFSDLSLRHLVLLAMISVGAFTLFQLIIEAVIDLFDNSLSKKIEEDIAREERGEVPEDEYLFQGLRAKKRDEERNKDPNRRLNVLLDQEI